MLAGIKMLRITNLQPEHEQINIKHDIFRLLVSVLLALCLSGCGGKPTSMQNSEVVGKDLSQTLSSPKHDRKLDPNTTQPLTPTTTPLPTFEFEQTKWDMYLNVIQQDKETLAISAGFDLPDASQQRISRSHEWFAKYQYDIEALSPRNHW